MCARVCVRNGQSALRALDTEGVKMLQDQSKLQIWQSPIIAKYHRACAMYKFCVIIECPLLGVIIVQQNSELPGTASCHIRLIRMTGCT